MFSTKQTPAGSTAIKTPSVKTPAQPGPRYNPYVPRMSFASGIVPKTTNKTAGFTPYPACARPEKRKLDYSSTGKTKRNVGKQRVLSTCETSTANKMFYIMLPDGNVVFVANRGHPHGAYGYWAPAIRAVTEGILNRNGRWGPFVERLNITSVFPIKDPNTGLPRKFHFAGRSKSMNIMCIVYVFQSVKDCTEAACDSICTNLVNEFNNLFDIKIAFGGNAES